MTMPLFALFENTGNAVVENDEALEDVGELFKNDPELLETTLTFGNMQSGGASPPPPWCACSRAQGD